jgi:IS5 family transposase
VYKKLQNIQASLFNFNQSLGLQLDLTNMWVKMAEQIPWTQLEDRYAVLFSKCGGGTVAKPLRMALGSLIIQKWYGLSDRDLVSQIQMNPYYQFFIGLPEFQYEVPFVPSLLVEFRKRLSEDVLSEVNSIILKARSDDVDDDDGDGTAGDESLKCHVDDVVEGDEVKNAGSLILDATCAPQNIRYPQDTSLLFEAREKLEGLIRSICLRENIYMPRTYCREAKREAQKFIFSKKRTKKKIREAIRKQLQYIRRDLGYIFEYHKNGYFIKEKEQHLLSVLCTVYEQQQFMYENKVHSVPNRIVSISQPYIRPIVRGKANATVEFGAKLDMSLVDGYGRIERLSFDAFNESDDLVIAIDRYKNRTGFYPERVLADRIYRNKTNLAYCKKHGIRLLGPRLGRPPKDVTLDKQLERQDRTDRIEVERAFSLAKGHCGLGRIRTKLEETTRSSIMLSIITMNIYRIFSSDFILWFLRLINNNILKNKVHYSTNPALTGNC